MAAKVRPRAAWIISTTSVKACSSAAAERTDVVGRRSPWSLADFDGFIAASRRTPGAQRSLGRQVGDRTERVGSGTRSIAESDGRRDNWRNLNFLSRELGLPTPTLRHPPQLKYLHI